MRLSMISMARAASAQALRDRDPRQGADAGFTITELMVALGALLVMTLAILSLLFSAMQLQSRARARTIAALVAERTLEEARSWEIQTFQAIIDNYGGRYTPEPVREGPFVFNRTIDVAWEEVSGTANPAAADYLRVSVEVTWNNMGTSPPVRMTTYVTGPPCEPNSGYISVRVTDHLSYPLANVALDLFTRTGLPWEPTRYTSSEGTWIFTCVFAGDYEITGTLSGYIARDRRDRAIVPNVSVAPQQVTNVEFQLARPATLNVRFFDQTSGLEITGPVAVQLSRTDFGPLVVSDTSPTRTGPITIDRLWPDSYSLVAAGFSCTGGAGFMSAAVGEIPITLVPGTNNVDVFLSPGPQATVEVTVLGSNESPVQNAQVRAVDACGVTTLFPNTDINGTSQRSGILPGPYVVYALRTSPSPALQGSLQVIVASDPTRVTVPVS